jgi:hypothetical protein
MMRFISSLDGVERSDIHQSSEDDGFRRWLNPFYGIIVSVAK